MVLLNEWVFDARLMEKQVTRLFILPHTDTTFIDRPTDSVTSPFETLWRLSVTHSFSHHLLACLSSVVRPSLSVRRFLSLSLLLLLFVSLSSTSSTVSRLLSVALYILKSGVPFHDYRPIVIYHYSVRTKHVAPRTKGFLHKCPLY